MKVGLPESGAEIQNVALLGVGTTADASNPFSAKLNASLWTARYAGEGGSGDLFYTLNKEAAGGDLGYVFQTDFVTKALVGLFGSDKFRLVVSADGSTFFDGLSVDNAEGQGGDRRAASPRCGVAGSSQNRRIRGCATSRWGSG